MCQLMGMNSSKPAAVGFSFAGFAERGGGTDEHKDGWGIAFHDGQGCRLITGQDASASSARALALKQSPPRARNVIAHIRKATQGPVTAANSHPFTRELWGRTWSFAHNGDLRDFAPPLGGRFRPAGQTDSERAFCHLLERLRGRFGATAPARRALFEAVEETAAAIAAHGSFNFLLTDGDILLAHCGTSLHYVVREYPFRSARLADCDLAIDFGRHNHLDDRIAIIATAPLTRDEAWHALKPGELAMFVHGAPVCAHALADTFSALPISY